MSSLYSKKATKYKNLCCVFWERKGCRRQTFLFLYKNDYHFLKSDFLSLSWIIYFLEVPKWVEALIEVEKQVEVNTRVIHIFDRERACPHLGDISEVFDQLRQIKHTGVLVRAAHNRSLDQNSERLWAKMESEPIRFEQEIDVPATANHKARRTKLAVRFSAVNLRTPYRFEDRDPLKVYAVYATELDCPEGETPLSWMLLTTEVVEDVFIAATILRWYTYRWRVEDYHKILKSGCQSERYRLAAVGMKTLLGFLSVIAVELLQVTYLHRTQPDARSD